MRKKITKFHLSLFDSIPLKTKLLFIYFILIVLPLGFFTLLSYTRVSNIIQSQTTASALQLYNEAVAMLDKSFENINSVINIITHDSYIYEISSRDPENYDVIEQINDNRRLTNSFNYLKDNTNVDKIQLYFKEDYILTSENVNTFSMKKESNSKWYKALASQNSNTFWFSPDYFDDQPEKEQGYFAAARIIYNLTKYDQKLAILRVGIHKNRIEKILSSANLTDNSCSILINESNDILSSVSKNAQSEYEINITNLKKLPVKQLNSMNISNQKMYVIYKKIALTDWFLVSIIPHKDIFQESISLRNEMLLIMLVIAILSYSLAYIISSSSIRRLSLLTSTMKKIKNGDLNIVLNQSGNDEIGQLINSYNEMISQLTFLLDEKYKLGKELKNLELKALQAQINPHFLYNSLDLVNCIALKYNIPDIVTMVNALAKFYKLSLSNGNDIISIKDELTHVQIYVQIQNMRFDNRIKFIINIDKDIYKYKTIKIILQPIIENSIIHGIFEKDSKSGTLQIFGAIENEDIIITVIDDGIGVSREKIDEIFSDAAKVSKNRGYGIKNINDRIKLAFGDSYGLSYSSVLGEGTTVKIKIPIINEEEYL